MIADTSFLLALVNPDDEHHAQARSWYEKSGPQTVQQTTLVEALQVVHYSARRAHNSKMAREQERVALGLITQTFGFHVEPVRGLDRAIRLYHEHDRLSFVDACGIADAHQRGGLWTFDKHQSRIARSLSG